MANPVASIILTAVDKTKAAFGAVKGGLASIGTAAVGLKTMLGAVFTGLSVVGLVGSLKQVIDAMDRADEAAGRVGTSASKFSALTYAAEQSGVSVEELEGALAKLSRTLADAQRGGAAADVFARLEIDPRKFSDPADALAELAERFAQMPDGIAKTALAQDLFGRSGAKLIPLLNQGREGMAALREEAERLGVVFTDEAAASAATFNDNLDKLRAAGRGFYVEAVNELVPGLTQIAQAMTEAARDGGILKAAWVGLGGLGAAIFTDDLLSNTQKLAKAQNELAVALDGARRAGIGDTGYITRKRAEVAALEAAVAAEKEAEERRREESEKTRDALSSDSDELVSARKKATQDQIADAERLADALRSAFEASTRAEEDYLRQAKKLRAEANSAGRPASGDVEGQAAANLDAITRMMRLQREAATASLDDVQAQAEALRDLAGALDDQQLQQEAIRQSKLAEAAALERAAAEERTRYQGITQQQATAVQQADELTAALEGLEKGAQVDVRPGPGVQQTKQDLAEILSLLDRIGNRPLAIGDSASGTPAQMADSLRRAALQYGRRQ